MSEIEKFQKECIERINGYRNNKDLLSASEKFGIETINAGYSYNFKWLGRPIIQYPQDIIAMQEIIWAVKPDLIIETGIAHGGSLIFSASMLALLEISGYVENACVLGIDIDIRPHNKLEIEKHPLSNRIKMIQGSSVDESVVKEVHEFAKNHSNIMVVLDSNHTHQHVLAELKAYSSLTTIGSYCVVFDTIVEDLPEDFYQDRPWGIGNNPKTAVREFLKGNTNFEIDKSIESKLLITVAPDGYLKRIK